MEGIFINVVAIIVLADDIFINVVALFVLAEGIFINAVTIITEFIPKKKLKKVKYNFELYYFVELLD